MSAASKRRDALARDVLLLALQSFPGSMQKPGQAEAVATLAYGMADAMEAARGPKVQTFSATVTSVEDDLRTMVRDAALADQQAEELAAAAAKNLEKLERTGADGVVHEEKQGGAVVESSRWVAIESGFEPGRWMLEWQPFDPARYSIAFSRSADVLHFDSKEEAEAAAPSLPPPDVFDMGEVSGDAA